MTPDYKALADRCAEHAALHDSLAAHSDEQRVWAEDLRTVVTMLEGMADEKPALWMQSNHVSWAGKQPFMARCAPTQLQPDFVPLHLHPAPQPQLSYEDIAGAIARAWCHQKNEHKEMDADLALAAANEVMEVLLHGAPQPQPILSGYGDYGAAIPGIERSCTCHPDDNPPVPCAQKYALNECRAAPQPHPDPFPDEPEWEAPVEPTEAQRLEGAIYGIIDPDYGRVYTITRKLAWEEGYAIGLHGSFTRDLDMIAVPWADAACEPEHLIRRIADAAGLKVRAGVGDKPHGRLVWTLFFPAFGDPRFVDLSVMPRMSETTEAQIDLPNVVKTAPERIYLVIGEDCPDDAAFDGDEVTWCADKINDNSIPYVRADRAALAAKATVKESLPVEPTEAQIEAAEAKPVAWMDEFGNAFPLDAWKPAKRTYLDDHKKAWKPLFTHPAPQPTPEGWQVVPKQPTPEMLNVFHDRIRILCKPDRHEAEVLNDCEVWALMLAAAPHPAPQPQPAQPPKCGCRSCLTPAELLSTFVVCPKCGNKRCPKADNHRNACTDSNAPGQAPQPERQPASEPTEAQIEAWAHEIWAAAQTAPCEGIENAVDRIVGVLRAAIADEVLAINRSEPTEAWQLLADLVAGLEATHWSSWQTTAHFDSALDAARAALAAKEKPE